MRDWLKAIVIALTLAYSSGAMAAPKCQTIETAISFFDSQLPHARHIVLRGPDKIRAVGAFNWLNEDHAIALGITPPRYQQFDTAILVFYLDGSGDGALLLGDAAICTIMWIDAEDMWRFTTAV